MMTIGAVARQAGVRASAIRFYEGRGLVRPFSRLANGYRVYDNSAVEALRFVRRAQKFGITLEEVKQLLQLARRGERPCKRVRELTRHHLTEVEHSIRELHALRREL